MTFPCVLGGLTGGRGKSPVTITTWYAERTLPGLRRHEPNSGVRHLVEQTSERWSVSTSPHTVDIEVPFPEGRSELLGGDLLSLTYLLSMSVPVCRQRTDRRSHLCAQ